MKKLMLLGAALGMALGAALSGPSLADGGMDDAREEAKAREARAEREREARSSGRMISVPGYGWMYVGPGRSFTSRNQGRDMARNDCACSRGGSYSRGKTGGDMGY